MAAGIRVLDMEVIEAHTVMIYRAFG